MVWPLIIGAAIGALAGGFSGGEGFDMKRALAGGALGAFTGGMGGAALGGIPALGATTAATTGAATAGTLGGTAATGLAAATPVYASGITASGLGAGGMGGGALTGTAMGAGAQGLGYLAPMSSYGASAAYTAPSAISGGGYPAMNFAQRQAASAPYTTGGKKDFSQLGDAVQGSLEEEPESPIDAQLLREQEARGGSESSSIEQELAAAAENMRSRITPTPAGLRNVEAAKGGMMRVPSGSLTGGLLVGPGTGTSDSISSAIFPDVASKLGASSMQNIQGGGHIQPAALSDGEYVLTAKAVKGFGKQAGAPPGQEREYGSKLLDNVMNQMQRV